MHRIPDFSNSDEFLSPDPGEQEKINASLHAVEFSAHQLLLASLIVGLIHKPRAVEFTNNIRTVIREQFYELDSDNVKPEIEDVPDHAKEKNPLTSRHMLTMRRDELLSFATTICAFFHMSESLGIIIRELIKNSSTFLGDDHFTLAHVSELHDYLHEVIDSLPDETEKPDFAWEL